MVHESTFVTNCASLWFMKSWFMPIWNESLKNHELAPQHHIATSGLFKELPFPFLSALPVWNTKGRVDKFFKEPPLSCPGMP